MIQVYCNLCFESKEEKELKFFVTSCFHVFCEGCLKNTDKYCIICKKQSKVLPINDDLPSEVRNYFDPSSIGRMVNTIEKIYQFMENQSRVYVKKNYHYRSVYQQYKKSFMEMREHGMKTDAAINREMSIINRLKQAYQTNLINPSLFQLRSSTVVESKEITSSSGFHSNRTSSVLEKTHYTSKSLKEANFFQNVRKEVNTPYQRCQSSNSDFKRSLKKDNTQNVRR